MVLIMLGYFATSETMASPTYFLEDSLNPEVGEIESEEETYTEPDWIASFAIGLNIGHNLELNSLSGTDKKEFSSTNGLDLGLNYYKEGASF
jgi:hypothetical protein